MESDTIVKLRAEKRESFRVQIRRQENKKKFEKLREEVFEEDSEEYIRLKLDQIDSANIEELSIGTLFKIS